MQWLATTGKEQTRFFTCRQVGDCTDKVGIRMEWEWNINNFYIPVPTIITRPTTLSQYSDV